ncbi:helix-turn-helix domain-containing protein [Stackebrandtia soli]|uniref:helix-turn-helix domain-containing protein n=1 Tax=Stackebrandtia soli TaxID=1892856 RepID=UPI0039EC668F
MTTVPKPDPRIPPLVSLREAARILGKHKNTVLKRARAGQLQCARVDEDGEWVFVRSHIEWVAKKEAREDVS